MLDQQIGDAFHRQRTDLTDVGGVVQHTGSDGFIELKRLIDELERGNQHIVKGSRFPPADQVALNDAASALTTKPALPGCSALLTASAHQINRRPQLKQRIV